MTKYFETSIRKSRLNKLSEKIKMLNRKAERMQQPEIIVHVGDEYTEKVWHNSCKGYIDILIVNIKVEGYAPKHHGKWRLTGVIESHGTENIVKSVIGSQVPSKFRTTPMTRCDGCDRKINRKSCAIVEHDGVFAQVGKSCVQDYLGYDLQTVTLWTDVCKSITSIEENEENEENNGPCDIDLLLWLSFTSAYISKCGWVPANDMFKVPTSDQVKNTIFGKDNIEVTDVNILEAKAAIKWAKSQTNYSDFFHNIRVIANSGIVSPKHFKIATAIIPCYQKSLYSQRTDSNYVGDIGKRYVFRNLELVRAIPINNMYGLKTVCVFRDSNDNEITWMKTGEFDHKVGDSIGALTATVKDHSIYKGIRVTQITRGTMGVSKKSNALEMA